MESIKGTYAFGDRSFPAILIKCANMSRVMIGVGGEMIITQATKGFKPDKERSNEIAKFLGGGLIQIKGK